MRSPRRLAPSGTDRGTHTALCVLSAVAATLGITPATAAPQDDTRAKVDLLYEEAENATEAYNRADARADRLRAQAHRAQDRIARQQEDINSKRQALGSLAGAQYRSGGLDPFLALLLNDDPENYLDRAARLTRISAHQAGELKDLQDAMRELARDRARTAGTLVELEKTRAAVTRHKQTVERKLAAARTLLNSLTERDRAAYHRASRSGRAYLPGSGGPIPASGRAAAAVAAARTALGKPYVWGADGPSGFDCSGLVQWSYGQAGVSLPRTSQEQRYAGRRVPLSEARPGDIVTYRSDASHAGMYMGDGQVIHAPHPGAAVRYDPVGMLPGATVTRL